MFFNCTTSLKQIKNIFNILISSCIKCLCISDVLIKKNLTDDIDNAIFNIYDEEYNIETKNAFCDDHVIEIKNTECYPLEEIDLPEDINTIVFNTYDDFNISDTINTTNNIIKQSDDQESIIEESIIEKSIEENNGEKNDDDNDIIENIEDIMNNTEINDVEDDYNIMKNSDDMIENNNCDPKIKLLISNMNIISNIKLSQKLWLENNELSYDKCNFPKISRWRYSQNRYIIIKFINEMVNQSIDIIKSSGFDSDDLNIQNLKYHLNNLSKGLIIMGVTYTDLKEDINKIINLIKDNQMYLI
jgi:hypothetical protein